VSAVLPASPSTRCSPAAGTARLGLLPLPEGRNQLLPRRLQYAGEAITEVIDEAATNGGMYLVRQFVEFWRTCSSRATSPRAAR